MYLRNGRRWTTIWEEIAIAKRIEAGKDVMINANAKPNSWKKIAEWRENIQKSSRDIIDIDSLMRFNLWWGRWN